MWHVFRHEKRARVQYEKPERKHIFGRPSRNWKDNIENRLNHLEHSASHVFKC